jgi:hypothetical protein
MLLRNIIQQVCPKFTKKTAGTTLTTGTSSSTEPVGNDVAS